MTQALEYEPGDARTPAWSRAIKSSAPMISFLAIVASWGAATFGLFLFPVAVIFIALLVPTRRWRLLALCGALSPMSLGFAAGAVGYVTGTARLQDMGLPGMGFYNLDPELRCERATGGCLTNGGEALTQLPNNLAVVALTRLFGPQRGAYTGPYPDETQAKAALGAATNVSPKLLCLDQVDVTTPAMKLDTGVGRALLQHTYFDRADSDDAWTIEGIAQVGLPQATVYQQGCLILRIPHLQESAMIVLIDVKTGRPFAYYGEGEYRHRYPPVTWKE